MPASTKSRQAKAKLTVGESFDARKVSAWFVYEVVSMAWREAPPNPQTMLCPQGTVAALRVCQLEIERAPLSQLHIEEDAGVGWVYFLDGERKNADGHQF